MERLPRKIHTYESKLETIQFVESGESIAGAAEQELWCQVQEQKVGKLKSNGRGPKLTAEQVEICQLRAELARVKMERDVWGKCEVDS